MLKAAFLVILASITANALFSTKTAVLDWGPNVKALEGRVCVVTGATRGIGKGIALGLGEQGAIVYVTGRTKKDLIKTSDEITAKGGRGIPVVADHTDQKQIVSLFERVEKEQGRLDVLVNNCFSAVNGIFGDHSKKYWERDLGWWDTVNSAGLRGHYIASQLATPLMLKTAQQQDQGDPGLIVIVSSWGGLLPLFDAAYGIGKAAKDRMAADLANDLKGKPINVVSLWPGAVKTENIQEQVLDNDGQSDANKMLFSQTESTLFQGRAVAALVRDPKGTAKKRNGKIVMTADLGEELGFTEEDGTKPMTFRTFKFHAQGTILERFIPRFLKAPKWVLTLVGSRF